MAVFISLVGKGRFCLLGGMIYKSNQNKHVITSKITGDVLMAVECRYMLLFFVCLETKYFPGEYTYVRRIVVHASRSSPSNVAAQGHSNQQKRST
jgi:hypothetical protein